MRALHDSTQTGTYVILIPDSEAHHMPTPATMHTLRHDDGSVRVHIRAVPFTSPWAALGLLHELSHAPDRGLVLAGYRSVMTWSCQ